MGFTTVEVAIHNPQTPARYQRVNMIADTGAMYSLIPRQILEALGIKPLQRRNFTLANGERIQRDFGGALYRIGDRQGHAPVIFGEGQDRPLLGVTTLEALGLQVDPVTKELKPIELLLL